MLILLMFFLITTLILFLYFLFRLIKWVAKKKIRIKRALALVGVCMLAVLINWMFFSKMELIQSKVYPDLYLLKHPVSDKDSIHAFIKQKVNSDFFNHKEKDKERYKYSESYNPELQYRIRFYEYYTGTFLVPFGEAGTTHFIENEEDPGGFSSELIQHYNTYRIAEFELKFCKNDTLNYVGTINYYQGWDLIKTDTLINQCQIITSEELSETAEAVFDGN